MSASITLLIILLLGSTDMTEKMSNRVKRARDELVEKLDLEDFKQSLIKCDVSEIQAEMYKKQFQDFTNKVYHTINVRKYK